MKRNISAILCSMLALSAGSLFGDAQSSNANKTQTMPVDQGDVMTSSQMPSGYNHPARVNTTSDWDMFLTARFLYWDVFQEGMEMGPLYNANPLLGTTKSLSVNSLKFKDEYRPGFKVGLGWNTPFDDWVVSAEYTWFQHDINKGQPSNTFLASYFEFPTGVTNQFITSSHKWNIDLDVVDVMLSRPCYQGTRLTINPSFGLKGILLNQKYSFTGNTAPIGGVSLNVPKAYVKTDSWAVGPSLGIGGNFLLGAGFRIMGSAEGALTFTRYNGIKYFFPQISPTTRSATGQDSAQNRVRAIGDAQAGFGWGTYLCNQKYHIDLSATYEFQIYWNQNMMNSYVANISAFPSISGTSPGNLYFQGLNVSAVFDF